jgi:hypothetical protein
MFSIGSNKVCEREVVAITIVQGIVTQKKSGTSTIDTEEIEGAGRIN